MDKHIGFTQNTGKKNFKKKQHRRQHMNRGKRLTYTLTHKQH
jgi:hypothetical protein